MASWNTILALFNPYTFSHSQGQKQNSVPEFATSAQHLVADFWAQQLVWLRLSFA